MGQRSMGLKDLLYLRESRGDLRQGFPKGSYVVLRSEEVLRFFEALCKVGEVPGQSGWELRLFPRPVLGEDPKIRGEDIF